jgi:sulfite dehydrogenase (cytochrome) subunit B
MTLHRTALRAVSMMASVAAIAGISQSAGVAVRAKPLSYELPPETAAFRPGPNLEVAQGNCTACHSADYIKTQPQGPQFKKDFWQAEVTKMIKVYGAPIDEADVGKIVEYLSQTY